MRIAIDLGHGVGKDRGAIGFVQEEEIINEVGKTVITKLINLGHIVYDVRPSGQAFTLFQSLSYRVTTSNNLNAEIYVSIHANAGGGMGTEIFTYKGKEFVQSKTILNNLVDLGFVNRGIKDGTNLYVIRHTNAKAMLIEICFVDKKSDIDKYKSIGKEKIAEAIVEGLVSKNSNVSVKNKDSSKNSKRIQIGRAHV